MSGSGRTLRFGHGGRDEGFDASLTAFAETGNGLVVMINANDNSRFMLRLEDFVARTWGWPDDAQPEDMPAAAAPAPISPTLLDRYAGYYEASENNMLVLVRSGRGTELQTLADGLPDEELLPVNSTMFGSSERAFRIAFTPDPLGRVDGVVLRPGTPRERRAPRVAPLPSSLTPTPDPDGKLTVRINAALAAIHRGGTALEAAADVTAGAKKDFAGGSGRALDGLGALSYLGQEDVTDRGIRRHGGQVTRVRLYRVTATAGPRYLLVHLTTAGSVTDYDVVER